LAVSLRAAFDAQLVQILGLARDAGAVTTGAVTVPLVLAMASLYPVLSVLLYGLTVRARRKRHFTALSREESHV